MSLPQYPKYKNSGVAWLGDVPEHWEIISLKHIISNIESGVSVNAIDMPATEEEIAVLKTSCVYRGIFDASENKVVVPEDLIRVSCPVQAGTLIVSRMNTPDLVGAAGLVTENFVDLFLPDRLWQIHFHAAKPSYIHFWTRSRFYRAQVETACAGTSSSMQNLSQEDFRNFVLPLPTLKEQTTIAAFLDRETAKIDALIAEQEKLITLLAEKRQATISHAVTKGLNQNAPMKNSGVAWLGDVPEHWGIKKIKRIVSMQSGNAITGEEINQEGTYPVYGGNGLRGYSEDITHSGEYLLIGRQGALCGNVHHVSGNFWASEHAVVCTFLANDAPRWAFYVLSHMNLGQYSVSAAQPGLAVERIQQLSTAIPPVPEQTTIAAFLDRETAKIDALTAEAKRGIGLLKERRAALISAAVTGKINVCNFV